MFFRWLFFSRLWLDASAASNHDFNFFFEWKQKTVLFISIRISWSVWSGIYEIFFLERKPNCTQTEYVGERNFSHTKKAFFLVSIPWTRMCWTRGRLKKNWWNMDFSFHFPSRLHSFYLHIKKKKKKVWRGN